MILVGTDFSAAIAMYRSSAFLSFLFLFFYSFSFSFPFLFLFLIPLRRHIRQYYMLQELSQSLFSSI